MNSVRQGIQRCRDGGGGGERDEHLPRILLEDIRIFFVIRENLHFWTRNSEIGKFLRAEIENWQERQAGVCSKLWTGIWNGAENLEEIRESGRLLGALILGSRSYDKTNSLTSAWIFLTFRKIQPQMFLKCFLNLKAANDNTTQIRQLRCKKWYAQVVWGMQWVFILFSWQLDQEFTCKNSFCKLLFETLPAYVS